MSGAGIRGDYRRGNPVLVGYCSSETYRVLRLQVLSPLLCQRHVLPFL